MKKQKYALKLFVKKYKETKGRVKRRDKDDRVKNYKVEFFSNISGFARQGYIPKMFLFINIMKDEDHIL